MAFLKSYSLARLESVFPDAVEVAAAVSGKYRYPDVCAACLGEDVASVRDVRWVTKDYDRSTEVITKTTTKVSFPICGRCRSMLDAAVSLKGQTVTFSNPRYGFAFVVANNLREYTCHFGEKDRSRLLADHLVKLGLPDMTKGIDWETARSFYQL